MPRISSMLSYQRRIVDFYRDREYFRQLLELGVPISLQSLVMASLNMVGLVMIGQKGDVAVAAVGLANQPFYLFTLAIFGITSGAAIFTAQLWGKKDASNVRKVLGLTLIMSTLLGVLFTFISEYAPQKILSLYSTDAQVVSLGSLYLQTYGWSFIFYAITTSFSTVHRSIGNVRFPIVFNIFALSLNTLLSYLLIFGKWGMPELGVLGAAYAVLISRLVECVSLVVATYLMKSPISAGWRELFTLDRHFIACVLKPVLPIAFNELIWSLGVTTYNAIYARIGTKSIAAIQIINSIDTMAYIVFQGINGATAIMVGNSIGSGKEKRAFTYAGRALGLSATSGIIVGAIILLGSDKILELFKVSPMVIDNAQRILRTLGMLLWVRAMNSVLIVGVLRGGGDARFSLFLDGTIIWIVGVPMALIGAFVFHLPVYWVYLMIMSDDICKWFLGMHRYFSKKWIHNLAHTIPTDSEVFP